MLFPTSSSTTEQNHLEKKPPIWDRELDEREKHATTVIESMPNWRWIGLGSTTPAADETSKTDKSQRTRCGDQDIALTGNAVVVGSDGLSGGSGTDEIGAAEAGVNEEIRCASREVDIEDSRPRLQAGKSA